MSLNWNWDEKCGEAIIRQNIGDEKREFTKSLYEGNAFLIFINEWEENGNNMYSLYTFFVDESHAKRCLGLDKKSDCTNIFEDGMTEFVKLRINKKKSRNWKKIVTLFAQAFDNIEIEIYSEDEKND